MEPLEVREGDCWDAVVLEPITTKAAKTLVWITAKDKNSGKVLHCEATVRKIHRIEIQSKYRQTYVNNNQHLQVVGYDDVGNVFTTLNGLRFDWTIIDGGQEFIKKVQV